MQHQTMRWHSLLAISSVLLAASIAFATERSSFNSNWRFYKDSAEGAEKPSFDDSSWRHVRLPHDWAIEGPFDRKYNARCGGLPFHGTGWYRKNFITPNASPSDRVGIEFDGAMYDAHVWVNGQFVGHRPYGYIGFEFDITDLLKSPGEENVIAVRLQPEDLSSRWYPGAGIYRNVWLNIRPAVHVPQWGVSITTPSVSNQQATVEVKTTVKNLSPSSNAFQIRQVIIDATGYEAARQELPLEVNSAGEEIANQRLAIDAPIRWDVESPYLYVLKTQVLLDDVVLDEVQTPFGIRTLEFGPDFGFKLNGRQLKLNGVCLHHDLGPLGAAVNRRATQRQLEIMKSMGVNAIRTSHNPPSPEQLELCDQLGLLVIDEAFDCWRIAKVPNGYNKFFDEWHEQDLRDLIRRDRNHPSVILWSIGNEILEQGVKDGWKVARTLADICRAEDPSRLTTAGFNYYPGSYNNKLAHEIDVVGLNYKPMFYAGAIKREPGFVLYGSETSSCTSSRGVYHLPIEAYQRHPSLQVSSYDLIGPKWAYPPDVEFQQLAQNPSVFGEFVWTGFDYLGEPTPYGGRDNSTTGYWNADWPSRSSYFGCVDLCGLPKDRFYLYQSQWTSKPMAHLLPHWNWEVAKGTPIPVYCFTNGDEAELFHNGRSLGRKKKGVDKPQQIVDCNGWPGGPMNTPYRLRWEVPYAAGELEVVAYRNGLRIASDKVTTASAPSTINLKPDRLLLDGADDLSFVTVSIVDEEGILCPRADNRVSFKIEGPARIVAVGNGDATSTDSFQANSRRAFSGQCMVIIGPQPDGAGAVRLTAASDGLEPITIKLKVAN